MIAGLGRVVSNPWTAGVVLVAVSALLMALNTDFSEPPRGDGAGYAVLGASIAEGRGYREIDKPQEPRHAHYPPGYPFVLAVVLTVAGRSEPVAHAVSIAFSTFAVLLAWRWFRSWYRPGIAFGLALALALNWTWARLGGAILSEPVYQFWQMLALVMAGWVGRKGGIGKAVLLGLVLGSAMLTRYVGVALGAAVLTDLGLRKRFRETLVSGIIAGLILLPWVVWMGFVGRPTHLGLLPGGNGLMATVAQQSLFYLQRLPDQIVGPVVEVGTIYRRSVPVFVAVHVWAVLATGLVLAGWVGTIRTRRRIAGLWGFFTLALLLVWPFTEAGRFLVPLVPALLVGAVEGFSRVLAWTGARRRARGVAVVVLVVISVPYTVQAARSHLRELEANRQGWESFTQACGWLSEPSLPEGTVLTRHPAEVYWLSGRQAWTPEQVDLNDPEDLVRRGIRFVLVEPGPPGDPLERLVEPHPSPPGAASNVSVHIWGKSLYVLEWNPFPGAPPEIVW